MNLIESIILGIVQGLTEFLPVSSSGHLEIGKALLGVEAQESLIYTVVVQGTVAISQPRAAGNRYNRIRN